MKVVFIRDAPGIAKAGEIKEVSNGYGRNFLIPQKLARPLTEETLQEIRAQTQAESRRLLDKEQQIIQMAQQLDGASITLEAKAGPRGRLYGSITNADIAKAIEEQLQLKVDKRCIELAQSIRELGSFTARIKLNAELAPVIRLLVKEGSRSD